MRPSIEYVDKFKTNCKEILLLCVQTNPWFPNYMGWQIINSSLAPVRRFGEIASETRKKYYKNDKKLHARKNCRLNNMTYFFYKATDSPDL